MIPYWETGLYNVKKLIMFTFNNNIIVLLAVIECDTVRV